MNRLEFTNSAIDDVDGIWDYIAEDNPDAADVWVEKLYMLLQKMCEHPLTGHARDELHPNLRSHVFGNYMIYFLPADDGIQVVRVLHGAMDVQPEHF